MKFQQQQMEKALDFETLGGDFSPTDQNYLIMQHGVSFFVFLPKTNIFYN
jgi:hypothetical protein